MRRKKRKRQKTLGKKRRMRYDSLRNTGEMNALIFPYFLIFSAAATGLYALLAAQATLWGALAVFALSYTIGRVRERFLRE